MLWKWKITDIEISRLDFAFVSDFEFYLRSVRKCAHNTPVQYLFNFKKVVSQCVQKGRLSKDPFRGYKLAAKEVVRELLTRDKPDRIGAKAFSTERLQVAREVFLLCCYTGLADVDVERLQRCDSRVSIDGGKWILARRQKTESPFRILLLSVPLQIIERCEDHPTCVADERVLPVASNQKLDEYLKEAAVLCGIRKRLTDHMAQQDTAYQAFCFQYTSANQES